MTDAASSSARDAVWKALADPSRRRILELLAERPRTTGELCRLVDGIGRTGVLQHLAVLTAVNLVVVRRDGRRRWNHIECLPLITECHAWFARHVVPLAESMHNLKAVAEQLARDGASAPPDSRSV